MPNKFVELFDKFYNFLGRRCQICGVQSEAIFCNICASKLTIQVSDFCPKCGLNYQEGQGIYLCSDCRLKPRKWSKFGHFGRYQDLLAKCISEHKFGHYIAYNKIIAKFCIEIFESRDFEIPDFIIPVPLHQKKLVQRGYNQCLEFSKPLSKKLNVKINVGVLQRKKHTIPQVGLSRERRLKNVLDSFIVNKQKIWDKHILLIDDVFTTGTTLGECTNILLKNGAKQVDVLVIARA